MTNTDTADAPGTATQILELAAAGSEIVRITVNTDEAAATVSEIAARVADAGVDVPIVGDFHYNGHLLLERHPDAARALSKYRINHCNVGSKRPDENFRTNVAIATENGKAKRIGVNCGSLDQDLLTQRRDETERKGAVQDARGVRGEARQQSAS